MAGRRLFSKSLAFLAPSSPPLRHHSAAAVAISAETGEANIPKPAVPISQSDSVLSVLRSRGLTAGDITGSASCRLLDAKLGRDLESKVDLLLGLGFSTSDVVNLLLKSNFFSHRSLASLKQRIEFLRSVVDDDGGVVKMIKRWIWTISASGGFEKRIANNIAMLKEWGLADRKIKSLLVSQARFFLRESESIVAAAERAQTEFGVAPDSKMFIYHLLVWSGQSNSRTQEKIRVFERFGWQSSDVHALARTNPLCFMLSAAKLEKGLEFLMNTAGLSPYDMVNRASLLTLSLEGRVAPRYHLIQALKSKCLVRENLSLYWAVGLMEKDFRKKFVDKFMELEPDACKAYMSSVTLAQKK